MGFNFFSLLVIVLSVTLIGGSMIGLIAPSLNPNVEMPTIPDWPTWASDLNWNISLTDWSGIGSGIAVIVAGIAYFFSFIFYAVSISGVMFQLIGIAPWIGYALSGVILLLLIGSLLTFIRGGGGGSK